MKDSIIFIFLVLLFQNILHAQDQDCAELLRYGVFNTYNSIQSLDNYSLLQRKVEDAYDKNQQDKKEGKTDLSYGLFDGDASFSGDKIESLHKLFSSNLLTADDLHKFEQLNTSIVSHELMAAYIECRKISQSNSGLKITSTMNPDGSNDQIKFDLVFHRIPSVPVTPKLTSIEIRPKDCAICSGELFDMAAKHSSLVLDRTYTMFCTRKIFDNPEHHKGVLLKANSGLISINTDMGNYTLWLPVLKALEPLPPPTFDIAIFQEKKPWSDHITMGDDIHDRKWYKRQLSDVVLSSTSVTLNKSNIKFNKKGKYLISASAPAYQASRHKLCLREVGTNEIRIVGTSEFSVTGTNKPSGEGVQSRSTILGILEITDLKKEYFLDHYLEDASGRANGLSFETSVANTKIPEVFAQIVIQKIQ